MSESERLIYGFRDKRDLYSHHGVVVSATTAGAKMVEFVIRSLSTMAFANPSIQAHGLVPYLGTSLEVYWNYAVALCAGIVAVQLALSILVYDLAVRTTESASVR